MGWYCRLEHAFGKGISVGAYATRVADDGRLVDQPLPDDVADHCKEMPSVYVFREEESDKPVAPLAKEVEAESEKQEPATTVPPPPVAIAGIKPAKRK